MSQRSKLALTECNYVVERSRREETFQPLGKWDLWDFISKICCMWEIRKILLGKWFCLL